MAGTQSDHQLEQKLASFEGRRLLSAHGALLKGVLESSIEVRMLVGDPNGPFRRCFQVAARPHVAALLAQHGTIVRSTIDTYAALNAASRAAQSAHRAFALIENGHVDENMDVLVELAESRLPAGGGLGLLLEDDPASSWATCPRQVAERLGLSCLEPTSVGELRAMMETTLQVSQADRRPVALIVHTSILRTSETLTMLPNRVNDSVDAQLQRRRRRQHPIGTSEAIGALRAARRLELNVSRAMPSPGERVAVGFITVGPADASLTELISELRLSGRVPIVGLRMTNPVDEAVIERLLDRCLEVVVIEPRPGSIEDRVIRVSERMRQAGGRPATVWGRQLPDDGSGHVHEMSGDSDLHPSRIISRIGHLLARLRPGLSFESRLVLPPGPEVGSRLQSEDLGVGQSRPAIRRQLAELDEWLREQENAVDEDTIVRSALALDGIAPPDPPERLVSTELWDFEWFRSRGTNAVAQIARESGPTLVLLDGIPGSVAEDIERLVKGAIPAKRADHVAVRRVSLAETILLREALREASMQDEVTIILIDEGVGVGTDAADVERELAEIDRLGFQPRRRLGWPVEDACAIRRESLPWAELPGMDPTQPWFQNEITTSRLPKAVGPKFRFRLRVLHEQVQVQRVKPPVVRDDSSAGERPPLPRLMHARQSIWRAHLAGFRSAAPGVAAWTLCEAGHAMGFAVRCLHDPTPISHGCQAWAQVLFTNPGDDDADLVAAGAAIPYGEADLLLGLEANELLQAVASDGDLRVATGDRTHCVANIGGLGRKAEVFNADAIRRRTVDSIQTITRAETRFVEDVASACRLRFRTDRLTDMTLLGVAFQRGLLPLTLDALEAAIASAERQGFGRSREAFDFGRGLGHDPPSLHRGRSPDIEPPEIEARRATLMISRAGGRRGRQRAEEFGRLVTRCLRGMPGLTETDAGRQARHDFVAALAGCVLWGGIAYAQKYGELILQLYQSDRGESGRSLTRDAILPLAESMLIRDAFYVSSVVTSGATRRRIRRTLNIRHARGDTLERRFLVRFELSTFRRRVRANIRTSDWFVNLLSRISRFIPGNRRGSRRERAFRQLMLDALTRLVHDDGTEYERHAQVLHELRRRAERQTLRLLTIADLRAMLSPRPPEDAVEEVPNDDVDAEG